MPASSVRPWLYSAISPHHRRQIELLEIQDVAVHAAGCHRHLPTLLKRVHAKSVRVALRPHVIREVDRPVRVVVLLLRLAQQLEDTAANLLAGQRRRVQRSQIALHANRRRPTGLQVQVRHLQLNCRLEVLVERRLFLRRANVNIDGLIVLFRHHCYPFTAPQPGERHQTPARPLARDTSGLL